MEAFFFKREYTIDNFNFLLNLLAEQQKADTIPSVIKKMLNLGILPDERSYNYMIKAAAMVEDTALAEIYFKQACKCTYGSS